MLLKLSKFFLYASLLSVVIVLSSTFFPFIGGKYYFFRVSVALALLFFLLWSAFEDNKGEAMARMRWVAQEPLVLAVSFFVLIYLLASVFAHNPAGAFWSNYERGEGAFQMLHYYIFFLLLCLLLRSFKEWRTAFLVSIAAAILVILYGLVGYFQVYLSAENPELSRQIFCGSGEAAKTESCYQFITPYVGSDEVPKSFLGLLTTARFQGSLGNPAYVAPYLIFSLFFVLVLIFYYRHARNSVVWMILLGALFAFFLFFFVLSQTRGAFLGLVAGAASLLLYLVWFLRGKARRLALLGIGGLTVVAVLLFVLRGTLVASGVPGSRFLRLGLSERSAQTRFWTWNSAWQGFRERPVLGWGPENFSVVFDKYFDPRHFVPNEVSETWYDRAHNIFLDYLASTGILGLAAYLLVFFVFYWRLLRTAAPKIQSSTQSFSSVFPSWVKALLFALPIAYLVQGLLLFEVLPLYLNLFLFFAFGFWFLSDSPKPTKSGISSLSP